MIFAFDFWNTLYHLPGSGESRSAVRSVALKEELESGGFRDAAPIAERLFAELDTFIKEAWRSGRAPTYADTLKHFTARWNWFDEPTLQGLRTAIERVYLKELRPITLDGTYECLSWCHSRGPVYLISDTFTLPGSFLRRIMNEDGILDYFAHLFFSDEVGVKKPNPFAFQQICSRQPCSPEDIYFVGDEPELDWRAANAAGAHCILLNAKPINSAVTAQIATSLREVQELLDESWQGIQRQKRAES